MNTHAQNRFRLAGLFSLIALGAIMTLQASAADLAGTWKGSMDTQAGKTQVVITIQPGTTLAGKVQLDDYQGSIENGKVSGDKIAFETTIDPGKVSFDGTVAADQMELNVIGTQGDRYKLVCVRQK